MDKEIFVQNVKMLCAEKGIKPTVACKESGAGKDMINQVERRGSVPSVENVQKLATYLGVTVSDLLGEEKATPAGGASGEGLSETDRDVMQKLHDLTESDRDFVLSLLDKLSAQQGK